MSQFSYQTSFPFPFYEENILERQNEVFVSLPQKQLASGSLQISKSSNPAYLQWTKKDHSDSYSSMQKIVSIWERENFAKQHLVYGKQKLGTSNAAFHWEIVPYHDTNNIISRIWKQFLVLCRIIFGGKAFSEESRQKQLSQYKISYENFSPSLHKNSKKIQALSSQNDAFCNPKTIKRQLILEGKHTYVLYNYAPIGFGGERLHFLLLPKKHKERFSEVSREEYLEITSLSKQLTEHFSKSSRQIQDIYLFHKTGADAGQSVKHWHMHMVITSNRAQSIFSKLTTLKNMLIGSSPMKKRALKDKVKALKEELAPSPKCDSWRPSPLQWLANHFFP